jgi:hypothetical protein
MAPTSRRVAAEVVGACVLGLIPAALMRSLVVHAPGPRGMELFLGSLMFVLNPGNVVASGLVGAMWPRAAGAVSIVTNAAIFGGVWFILRTRSARSKLRWTAIGLASLWLVLSGGLTIFVAVFGLP